MQFTIHFPESSQCLLKTGQDVTFSTPFLKKKTKEDIVFPLAEKLHVQPEKIFHYLKKFVGDPILKGDILAIKKGLMSTQKLISEYEGVLKEVNHTDGTIVITMAKEAKDSVLCFFTGHVAEVEKNKLVLKVKSGKEYPLKKTSGDFGGQTYYLENPEVTTYTSVDVSKKIVITESLTEYLETKFEAVGVNGFVSLNKIGDNVTIPDAQVKTIDDFKKIMKEQFAYCFIDSLSSRIVFYT